MSYMAFVLRRAEHKTPASARISHDNCGAQMWTEHHSTCRDNVAGTGCSRSKEWNLIVSAWHLLCPVFFLTAVLLFFLTAAFLSSQFTMPRMLCTDIFHSSAFLNAVEKERLSLWPLCDGNLVVGLLDWGP